MAKTLKFLYEGQEITLEFTRKSVEIMESNGFNLSAAAEKPMTTLPALFAGSFLAHHKYMKKEKIESETKWTYRIEKLESNQLSQDKKIAENEKEIADLKRFKCVNLTCNNRKQ